MPNLPVYTVPAALFVAIIVLFTRLCRQRANWELHPVFCGYLAALIVQLLIWWICYSPGVFGWRPTAADINGLCTIGWAMILTRRLTVAWPILQALVVAESFFQTVEVSGPAKGRHPVAVWICCWSIGGMLAAWAIHFWPEPVSPLSRSAYYFRTGGHLWLLGMLAFNLGLLGLMNRYIWTAWRFVAHQTVLLFYILASVIGDLPPRIAGWNGVTLAAELLRLACFAVWIGLTFQREAEREPPRLSPQLAPRGHAASASAQLLL